MLQPVPPADAHDVLASAMRGIYALALIYKPPGDEEKYVRYAMLAGDLAGRLAALPARRPAPSAVDLPAPSAVAPAPVRKFGTYTKFDAREYRTSLEAAERCAARCRALSVALDRHSKDARLTRSLRAQAADLRDEAMELAAAFAKSANGA